MTDTPAALATSVILRRRFILCIVTHALCSVTQQIRAACAGFAIFGAFWGAWGASLPALRDQAGLGDGELGSVLLLVGAGALPAMPLAGRAVDRWGSRVAAMLLVLLGAVGVAVAVSARDLVSVSVGLAL